MIGVAPPTVAGVSPAGVRTVRATPDGILFFITSSCLACREIWAALAVTDRGRPPDGRPVTVVTPDPTLEDPRSVGRLAGSRLEVVMSTATWQAYRVGASPWVTVVSGGRIAAEGTVADWEGAVDLARTAGVAVTGSGGPAPSGGTGSSRSSEPVPLRRGEGHSRD